MKNIALATVAALALVLPLSAGAAFAAMEDKPDYMDKFEYYCGKEKLTAQLQALYEDDRGSSRFIQVLYVKDPSEVSRDSDGLKCKVTMVHSRGTVKGYVVYKYEEGHSIVGFQMKP